MPLAFSDRLSDSPDIERVWRSQSDAINRMTSVATAHWTLLAWRAGREWRVAVQGPETGATTAPVPAETQFDAILAGRVPAEEMFEYWPGAREEEGAASGPGGAVICRTPAD